MRSRDSVLRYVAWSLGLWLIVGLCHGASAGTEDLYRAQTIVTGQGPDNREVAFSACLEDVLIKVSGAYQLGGDARLTPFKARAGDFVTGFDYHDRRQASRSMMSRARAIVPTISRSRSITPRSTLCWGPWRPGHGLRRVRSSPRSSQ